MEAQTIREILESNLSLSVAQVTEQEMPLKYDRVTLVEFHIAPKDGIYRVRRLEEFAMRFSDYMKSKVLEQPDFEALPHECDSRLYFGEIGFDTLLGQQDCMTGTGVKAMGLTDLTLTHKSTPPFEA